MTQIKALLEAYKITETQFDSVKICEERQLVKSLEAGSQDFTEQFSMVRSVFKMFIQNDTSVYYQEHNARGQHDEQSP